ncbi:MAG: polyferredoxin, partial [Planctomycetota bacterium]
KGASFVVTFIIAVMLWWVHPRVIIDGSLMAKGITIGIFSILTLGGLGHAFVWRFGFCIHVCPIGLYYRLVTSKAPVGIVFKEIPNPCIECGACEKICPVNIDPKALGTVVEQKSTSVDDEPERYGDAECIRCGDCIEACRMVFKHDVGAIPPLRFGRVDDERDQSTATTGDPVTPTKKPVEMIP